MFTSIKICNTMTVYRKHSHYILEIMVASLLLLVYIKSPVRRVLMFNYVHLVPLIPPALSEFGAADFMDSGAAW
jgi:hypothetical protein